MHPNSEKNRYHILRNGLDRDTRTRPGLHCPVLSIKLFNYYDTITYMVCCVHWMSLAALLYIWQEKDKPFSSSSPIGPILLVKSLLAVPDATDDMEKLEAKSSAIERGVAWASCPPLKQDCNVITRSLYELIALRYFIHLLR